MASKTNWKDKLSGLDHAVTAHRDPHLEVVRCGSPSVNALFGESGAPNRGWGLPRGFSLLMGGPPKGGKSTLINSYIGQFQRDYPDAFVVKIDTEFKESVQTDPNDKTKWGIDEDRYQCYERNDPQLIDFITGPLLKQVQDGLPLGLLVLDSFNNMEGFRGADAETAQKSQNQIGDQARTNQTFMLKVLPILRRHKISLIASAHVGAELDPYEQMRGHKFRIKTAAGTNHRIEYWMFVEKDVTKAGRVDLLEREFVRADAMRTGKDGKQRDVFAHRIKCELLGSSFGPVGREAAFTYDYERGIINQHEEVFLLAKQNDVLVASGSSYKFRDKGWKGKEQVLIEMEKDPALCRAMLDDLMQLDSGGKSVKAVEK